MNHNNFSNMYREQILELYKNPSNYGELKNPTHQYKEYNSLCGDEIIIQLDVKDGKVLDVKFHGSGCVISMVSSSLLTEKLKALTLNEMKKLSKEDIFKLLKIKVNPGRVKCALLPLEAVRGALK